MTDKETVKIMTAGNMIFRLLITVGIVASAGYAGYRIYKNKVEAKKEKPPVSAPSITVSPLLKSNEEVVITAWGTVIPARETLLRPQVSGKVVKINPAVIPGSFVEKGELLLQIERKDYELALERARAEVTRREYERKVEQGRQIVAKREWEMLNAESNASELEKELALRKPQLANAEAALKAAQADLEAAELNLQRTSITAPFNALVLTREAELGELVSSQDRLITLVDSDEYWIRVSMPEDRLSRLSFPSKNEAGASVDIFCDNGRIKEGRILRLLGNLEDSGKMARILIQINDPLEKNNPESNPPILLGSFLKVAIHGKNAENVYKIPSDSLRNGSFVWTTGKENTLRVHEVDIVWKNPEYTFVRNGFTEDEKLITSVLTAPVEGMKLSVPDSGTVDKAEVADDKNE